MKLRRAVVLAGLATAAPAAAADLAMPNISYPAVEGPTALEVGTNWYLRGDVGVALPTAPSFTLPYLSGNDFQTTAISGANGSTADFAGGLGVGYRVTDYLRLDATWTYWQGPERTRSLNAVCPYAFTPWPAAAPTGYLWDTTQTCAGSANLRQHNNTFLANAYVDLGTYSGFAPYVGGGVGANMNAVQTSSGFVETNGGFTPYSISYGGGAPNVWVNALGQPLSPQPSTVFASQAWTRSINQTNWRFAWALAAGIGYQITPSITLDVGYRYLNGGTTRLLVNPYTGLSVKQTAAAQMVTVGVRFVPQ